MSLWMLGGGGWQQPFNRTFFNVSLGEILKRAGREKGSRLTLHLIDASPLDVRAIEELSDQYVLLTASGRDEDDSDPRLHVLPYSAIYRIEIARAAENEHRRLGFRWMPIPAKSRIPHNGQPKNESSFQDPTNPLPSKER